MKRAPPPPLARGLRMLLLILTSLIAPPLLLALALGPFLGAAAAPRAGAAALRVLVASLDVDTGAGTPVGDAFLAYVAGVTRAGGGTSALPLPALVAAGGAGVTAASLRARVAAGDAAGAVWVNAGASATLSEALASPATAVYAPANAVGFAWSEGADARAPRAVGDAVRGGLLPGFVAAYAASVLGGFSSPAALSAFVAARPDLAVRPVAWTEERVHAASDVPVADAAVEMGSILMVRRGEGAPRSRRASTRRRRGARARLSAACTLWASSRCSSHSSRSSTRSS